jgi:hypothetical protein
MRNFSVSQAYFQSLSLLKNMREALKSAASPENFFHFKYFHEFIDL